MFETVHNKIYPQRPSTDLGIKSKPAFRAHKDLPPLHFLAHLLAFTMLQPLLAPSSLLQPSLPMHLLLEHILPVCHAQKEAHHPLETR